MKVRCETAKKCIALEEPLSSQARAHIDHCPECTRFSILNKRIDDVIFKTDTAMADDFAYNVMQRIVKEKDQLDDAAGREQRNVIFQRLCELWEKPAVVYSGVGLGGVVAVLNITRFVIAVLIPV